MSHLTIRGGSRLRGEAGIQGAKNSVLPILAACLLVPGQSVIHNCPDLSDVAATLDILRLLGCRADREGDTVTIEYAQPLPPNPYLDSVRPPSIYDGNALHINERMTVFPGNE